MFTCVTSEMTKKRASDMANVRLGKELEERLENLASTTGRTKTFYIKKLVEDHLDDIEDLYLAIYRSENPEEIHTLDEVKEELGLDD